MINTRSEFLFGLEIDEDNKFISFDEGSGELIAETVPGKYAPAEFVEEIARAMNDVGTLIYQCFYDRTAKLVQVQSTASNFTLKVATASTTQLLFPLMGFTGADRAGASSYIGDTQTGLSYRPQFLLQDFVDFTNDKRFQDGKVRTTANGSPEIVSFGLIRFMSCNIQYITDYPQPDNSPIEENLTAVADANEFMTWCINKGAVEFLPDRDNPAFTLCLLEKTSTSNNGLGYRLKEKFGSNLPGYYDTGKLEFRELTL